MYTWKLTFLNNLIKLLLWFYSSNNNYINYCILVGKYGYLIFVLCEFMNSTRVTNPGYYQSVRHKTVLLIPIKTIKLIENQEKLINARIYEVWMNSPHIRSTENADEIERTEQKTWFPSVYEVSVCVSW